MDKEHGKRRGFRIKMAFRTSTRRRLGMRCTMSTCHGRGRGFRGRVSLRVATSTSFLLKIMTNPRAVEIAQRQLLVRMKVMRLMRMSR